MRLLQNLSEDIVVIEKLTKNLLTGLTRNCDPYRKKCYRDGLLFRGVKVPVKWYKVITPRTNRRPYNTNLGVHLYLDLQFRKRFGWEARSQGVFATGSWAETNAYGTGFIIVPFGNFKFLWNPDIRDLFTKMPDSMESPKEKQWINDMLEGYKDTDFSDAMESGSEIMIKCTQYYLINPKYFLPDVLSWQKEKL